MTTKVDKTISHMRISNSLFSLGFGHKTVTIHAVVILKHHLQMHRYFKVFLLSF